MKNPLDEQVAPMHWCDISLCGFAWVEDGRDIVLDLLVPPTARKLRLTCRWATELQTKLELGPNTGGYPLSWDAEIRRRPDGSWAVALDFAGAGHLSLVCADLELSGDLDEARRSRAE